MQAKKRIMLASLTTISLFLSSLSAIAATATISTNTTSAEQSGLTASQMTDGSIMEVLIVADSNEINAAQEALKRTSNPSVENFAQTMINNHGQNLQAVKDLSVKINIAPIVTNKSTTLQKEGAEELTKLSSVPGNQFDITYMNAMVKGHEAVLKMLDNKLIPNASNPELKAFLTTTRATVAGHLQMAQAVQAQLTR